MFSELAQEWPSIFKGKEGELEFSESTRQILLLAVDQAASSNILLLISRRSWTDSFSLGNVRLDFET